MLSLLMFLELVTGTSSCEPVIQVFFFGFFTLCFIGGV